MVGRMSRWMGQYHDEWHAHLLSQQNPLTDNLSLWWAGWGSLRWWGPAMVYSVHGRCSRLLDLHIKKWSWSARRWRRRRPQFNIPYSFVVIAVHCRRYCPRHLHLHRLTVNPNSLRICHSAWMQTVFVIRHSAFAIRFLLFDIAKFYLIHNLLAVFTSVSFRFISSGYHQHHHHLHLLLLHRRQSNQHKEQRMTARSRIEKRLGYAYFSWRWWRPQRLQCRHASGPAVRHFVRQSIMFETSSFILCVSWSLPMRNHAANTQNIKPPSVWHNENAGGTHLQTPHPTRRLCGMNGSRLVSAPVKAWVSLTRSD